MPKKKTEQDIKKAVQSSAKKAVKRTVRKKAKKAARKSPIVALLLVLLLLAAYLGVCAVDYNNVDVGFEINLGNANVFQLIWPKSDIEPLPVPENGEAMYHFINVGQGDSTLITTPEGNILIDTGETDACDYLDDYLLAAGITDIEYLVITHPDSDHAGNAEHVVKNYKVKNVVLGKYAESDTDTYQNFLKAVEDKRVSVLTADVGTSFVVGGVLNTVIAPLEDYEDDNENSLVIRSSYGESVVILTGDAERKSEGDIVEGGKWSAATLKADILKVGHHGSTSSSSEEFLDAVSPKIAIISCGENQFGHPSEVVLDRLEERGAQLYRTDVYGSIIFKSNGKEITLVDTIK